MPVIKYCLTPSAVNDIKAILSFLHSRNPSVAFRYKNAFTKTFERLADTPYQGQKQPDIAPDARHWVISPYRILYRDRESHVEIVRVLRDSRNITPKMFQ